MNGIFIAPRPWMLLGHAQTRVFDDAGEDHNRGGDDGRDMVEGGKGDHAGHAANKLWAW